MDFAQSVKFYYECGGRQSAYCDPTLEEMQKKALGLDGAERAKAYQAIGKYAHDQVVTVPVGYPSFYYGLSTRLEWTPRIDGLILAREMKLKP